MLTEVDRSIWIADGPSVSFLGVPYPTRMTLVRLGEWIRDNGRDVLERALAWMG